MEETKVDDMYMENLEEWIFEEEKIVTYKYLSRALKIHVNVAKQMLFNFVEKNKTKHPDIGVVYLVSGLVPSNKDDEASEPLDQKVMCVKQEDLDRTLKGFSSILSQHIYSVQRNNNTVSITSLFCVDQNKNNQDMSVAAIAGLNSIKHKNAVPREAASVSTVIKKEIKTEPVVKKEPNKKTGAIQDAFNKGAKKSSPEKAQQPKSSGSSTAGKVTTKGKGGSGIASMFARQANKPPKPKSTEEKENIVNQKIEADTSSGSKDSSPEKTEAVKSNPKTSGSGSKKSSGKKSAKTDDGKKRKRIHVMSDSEDEEEDAEEREETVAEVEEAPPVSKLIESDEEEEEEEEEIAPTPVKESKARAGRRRVKKLVDKTYMDADGYKWP